MVLSIRKKSYTRDSRNEVHKANHGRIRIKIVSQYLELFGTSNVRATCGDCNLEFVWIFNIVISALRLRATSNDWAQTSAIARQYDPHRFLGAIWSCELVYEYQVESRSYNGTRTNTWWSTPGGRTCREIPIEWTNYGVQVFYDQKNPIQSLIYNSFSPVAFLFHVSHTTIHLVDSIRVIHLST